MGVLQERLEKELLEKYAGTAGTNFGPRCAT